jgi:DNA-binding MarR family transcriptional regulator
MPPMPGPEKGKNYKAAGPKVGHSNGGFPKYFHLLMHIGHLLEERCRGELAEFGLHHGQARVLMTLANYDGVNQADLARGMDVAPPTLSVMLKKLLDQKLVRRTAVKEDDRVYRISLTPAGRRAVGRITSVWANANRAITDSLGESVDLAAVHDQLLRVRDGLGGRTPTL